MIFTFNVRKLNVRNPNFWGFGFQTENIIRNPNNLVPISNVWLNYRVWNWDESWMSEIQMCSDFGRWLYLILIQDMYFSGCHHRHLHFLWRHDQGEHWPVAENLHGDDPPLRGGLQHHGRSIPGKTKVFRVNTPGRAF